MAEDANESDDNFIEEPSCRGECCGEGRSVYESQ